MSSPLFSRYIFPSLGALALLLATACNSPRALAPASGPDPLAALTYDGSQAALVALDHDIAAAGQNPAKLAAISTRLLALLRAPAASGAARQAAAQRLALFPAAPLTAGENLPLWAAMAADERQINFVKLALDHVPGEAVDKIFLRALDAAAPANRLAFVQSIGNRRIAAATPKLAPLLADSDPALAAAATKALGQIGTADALAALKKSPAPAAAPVIEARLTAAHHLAGSAGVAEFQAILDTATAPANLRAAALHGLLYAEPDAAPARLLAALTGPEAAYKPVVLEAIFALRSQGLVPALTAQLSSFDVATQVAVVAALGRRGDAAAVPAIADLVSSADASVRTAALTALGRLPANPVIANLLARVALGENADDAKLARQSLARLDGPRVRETILAAAADAETSERVVFIESFASRNMSDTVPQLLALRRDPAPAVRAAALGSLADLAPASEQRALLDWAIAATDANEQSRALRALAAVSARNPDAAECAKLVTEAIDQADAAVAVRLLPVLPRIGGTAAAECAARLALRDDARVATAATTTLSRWTDSAGLLPLIVAAEKAPLESVRTAAVEGSLRFLQRSRELSSANLLSIVNRLLATAKDPEVRRALVYLLSRCSDAEAVATLEKFHGDPVLGAEADDALLAIHSNLAGQPELRSSANPDQLRRVIDGKIASTWNVLATADQWLELDFKSVRPLRQVVVDGGGNQYNYPEHLDICVSDDPKNPGAPKASVPGHLGKNVIDLPAGTRGRYLTIRHSKERADSWWTVAEITWD